MDNQLQLNFINFKKDLFILVEGKQADSFFIIRQGKVRIIRDVAVEGEKDEILVPGDFFGVISAMSNHSHIETAQALTDVDLIGVHNKQYTALIQKNPAVAMKIITQFSKRLRFLNDTLAKRTLKSTAEVGPSHLFNVAEHYASQNMSSQAVYAYTMFMKHCPGDPNVQKAQEKIAEIQKKSPVNVKTEYAANELNRTYKKDTMLFAEGEPGEELFIIQSGSVKITKIIDNNEVMLAMLKAGDIVGEMALLEGKPRAASVIAYEDCSVMAVNKANFELMSTSQPALIAKVTTLLAERIWFIYKQLANTMLDEPIARMYDALYIQLEKSRVDLTSKDPYTFNFGQNELFNMIGLPESEAGQVLAKMLESKCISIADGKVKAKTVADLVKETEYHRKMDKMAKAKQENKQKQSGGM
jgi:CRP-like cAMP-binding protein